MRERRIIATIAAVAGLGGCTAEPQETEQDSVEAVAEPAAVAGPTEDERCGTRLDANQDGMVQEAEYNSFGFAFDNWDVDDDYRISPAEFQRCWDVVASGSAEPVFRAFDEDGNGFLSQEEFFSNEEFHRWDADGDGAIARAEFP